jgi:hypothetical protein
VVGWAEETGRMIYCACGAPLATIQGLRKHQRMVHPNLSARDRALHVDIARKILLSGIAPQSR